MIGAILAQADEFVRPHIDWHAVAPELTLLVVGAILTIVDIIWLERARELTSALAGLGLLAVMVPIITLYSAGVADEPRVMFAGAFVVDGYALVLKAFFVIVGYIVILLSSKYISEGDYWESEYYGLVISSILGMVLMASARDLISIFVALELLSIPAYLLAAWRKRDLRSNEAGLKYYLMGVFATAIFLYGMSLLFGVTGTTILADLNVELATLDNARTNPIVALGIVFVVIGFAFKVSAAPFHTWAPDTYEGAPTPVTAFLSVASKAAGLVALMNLVLVGFWDRDEVYGPLLWVLAAASMTIGNLIALRQENLVRLMAYSGVAQAGFLIAPLAVAGESPALGDQAASAIVTYLIIYAAMNLGAFGIILAVARRTRSAEVTALNGLFSHSPALAVVMTMFLASLAGIPPLGGWFAKFNVFFTLIDAGTGLGYVLAAIAAINTVIAFGYYGRLASRIWFDDAAPEHSRGGSIDVPFALQAALAITVIVTVVTGLGVLPWEDFADIVNFADTDPVAVLAELTDAADG